MMGPSVDLAQIDIAVNRRINRVVYSDDAVELPLLRLTEWLLPPRSLCLLWRLFPSFAGSPWTTPLRASIPPLTEKLVHTMKARIAAFS